MNEVRKCPWGAKKVGQLTLEKDWAVGKLKDLDSSKRLEIVDESESKILSVVKQCELLQISRSNIYYAPVVNQHKIAIKEEIKNIFEEIPIYGARVFYSITRNRIRKYIVSS